MCFFWFERFEVTLLFNIIAVCRPMAGKQSLRSFFENITLKRITTLEG